MNGYYHNMQRGTVQMNSAHHGLNAFQDLMTQHIAGVPCTTHYWPGQLCVADEFVQNGIVGTY
jgi:hypothetical protein